MSISFCISVCNEDKELDQLLEQLIPHIDHEDELIVLVDESKVTTEVGQVIAKWKVLNEIKVISTSLNNDFATFKNNFVDNATKDFIFQIDADELLSQDLLVDTKLIMDLNPNIDLYWLPRENYVEGLTEEYINKWGWRVDEKGRINWKDPQARVFKNNKQIKWINKVHEVIVGHKEFVILPDTYFLTHKKTLERQISQNEFYNTL